MGQNFVSLANFHLERSISHTFDYCSINRDHIFFWNDVTSFPRVAQAVTLRDACIDLEANDFPIENQRDSLSATL